MKVDYHIFKSMVNRYLSRHVGGGRRPVFFDIDSTFPALNEVTRSYAKVREEFDAVFARRGRLQRYHEVDPGEAKIANADEKGWKVFVLEILGHRPEENRALCPETCRVLDRVPNLIQAFFSVLDPGKSIPEHEGPYLGYLRYHLALRVPTDNPPKLIVNRREHVWQEGEAVLFDDSWPHAVVNHSTETRAVLIVDVMRPLPWVPSLVNRFVTNVVARHTYGRKVARRVRELKPVFD